MNSIRCDSCSLTNFATADVCKRCGSPLNSGTETDIDSHQYRSGEIYSQPNEGESNFWDQPSYSYRPKYVPKPEPSGSVATKIVTLVIVLVVFYVITAVAVPFFLKKKTPDFTNLSWSDYRSPDGKFSISLPATPKESTRVVPSPFGNVQAHLLEAEVSKAGNSMLLYADYPAEKINVPDELLYEMALSGTARNQSLWMVGDRREVTLNGYKGIEADLKPVDSKAELSGTIRIFWVSPRLYVMLAAGPETPEFKAVGARFLSSFKFSRSR